MVEFFDTYKRNKNPPNSYLCDNAITWRVSYGNLYDITGCVICYNMQRCGLLKPV